MSKQGNLGRPWTPYEDTLLTDAVRIYGENTEKWKIIASSVPGRTNKACRKRWLHSLSPTVKKCAWTPEEDQLLLSLHEKHPNKWSLIAREIAGRTDDACSKRYREALDPNLIKDDWSEEEDKRLLEILARHGGPAKPKWGLIGQELRRSGLGCRNRWRLLERKKKAATRQTSLASSDGADVIPGFPEDILPFFAEGGSSNYWGSSWGPTNLGVPDMGAHAHGGSELDVMNFNMEEFHMQAANSTTTNNGLDSAHPIIVRDLRVGPIVEQASSSHAHTGSTVSFTSYSLGAALTDIRPEVQSLHNGDGSTSNPDEHERMSCFPVSSSRADAYFDQLQADDSQTDNNISYDSQTFNNEHFFEAHVESVTISERQSDGNANRHEEQVFSLSRADLWPGPNEDAAVTAGPTVPTPPCPLPSSDDCPTISITSQPSEETVQDFLPPPRKRRRTLADSPASSGMAVFSVQSGKQKVAPKLSSTLPVAGDASILAYACGHSSCWPTGTASSSQCFSMSGELWNHFKDQHMNAPGICDETPFRCGLRECSKGWKSINGLQYHLQISKAHYQRALSTVVTAKKKQVNNVPHSPEETDDVVNAAHALEKSGSKPKKKVHKCPYTGCSNEYKQLSGLRYHLLHGHPKNLPTQLDAVPPTIARKLGVGAETSSVSL